MAEYKTIPVSDDLASNAWADDALYRKMYQESVINPEGFWREHGERIHWFKPYTRVKDVSYDDHRIEIKWFQDGTTNVSWNCLDRHLEEKGDQVAIYWEGDNPKHSSQISYRELHERVCRFANVLKSQGVRRGDVIAVYMPMVVEASIAMLACTRIGAIHSVIFAGFSPEAVAGRVIDSHAKILITADEGVRGGKTIPLKANVDEALTHTGVKSIEKVIVFQKTGNRIAWYKHRDIWWHELEPLASPHCEAREMDAESPLFILYTSGSTGKPKGVLHTTGGYLVYASMTHQYVFNYKDGDVYWCNADVGWITGHSYVVYGPLCNGATIVMHEGLPNYPSVSRISEIVDKYQINTLYTAPTAIRALMAHGQDVIKNTNRTSLKLLGSVGEPINPEAWMWYRKTIGQDKCPVVDTWWQTETGGIMITPLPGATPLKPGSATRPFFGVLPAIVDGLGNIQEGPCEGNLVMIDSWPGQARTVYGNHDRFVHTYFSKFKGMYFTGDGARRDEDGYYWITGRVDDVLNVAGHRMGTAEIESAMVSHSHVAEAAVVGYPHEIKGQGIYVYVTLNKGVSYSEELAGELRDWVRREIGPIATPDIIQNAPGLPKTRSGKIMRRILRQIAAGEFENLGDTSTLADPSVIDQLIDNREAAG
ncbi:acetate--CoA ligase [Sansalvadorimonas sp. 2012CJ34-2]|uniref:Acetyl-coenzyme A synthetase n=1 Tax=Parendozoicomonas callyspongiae TaxID=2942213 RepID=A0ABT0PH96_9GAMM|nr:acetate--CoA ligase [Sansalvadorimonas sp. 2012CJ34-2]MCL6270700.1 acetate--CoA ligase [Sansalvadorimonas sp. 2012CJ34-2]